MKTMTEVELSAVAGATGHRKPSKLVIKKIGDVTQSNSFAATQAVADLDVYGDLNVTAYAEQSNSNSGSIS
jgi:hypothetical protein